MYAAISIHTLIEHYVQKSKTKIYFKFIMILYIYIYADISIHTLIEDHLYKRVATTKIYIKLIMIFYR